jgi:hypothetical protein
MSVANWTSGSLSAGWVGTLKSAATLGAAIVLTGTAAPHGVALQSLTVAGDDTGGISATGNVGSILVRGQLSGTTTIVSGGLKSLRVLGGIAGTVTASDGTIGSITALGTVGPSVLFVAGAFPKRAILGGVAVDPTTDAHFQSSAVAVPLGATAG